MRFSISVLGTEILTISTDRPTACEPGEHDTNCSQAELANSAPVGFHIQPIPSLIENRTRRAKGSGS